MDKTLSEKERLIIANQYEILSRLAKDEQEKKDFELKRDIFVNGFSKYYSLATECFCDEMTEEECEFVINVLDLYRDLYYSWSNNDDAKEKIEERKVLFKGFDLNDEIQSKYYSFYKFLVEDLDKYIEIKELMKEGKIEGFNSHGFGPKMKKLSKMISKRKELRDKKDFDDEYLSVDEMDEILNA